MGKTLILSKPVIAITGSAGKTTTRELIAAILSTKWSIFKTPRNLNHFSSTRQYAKAIRAKHKAAVLEYGMSQKGSIRKHCLRIQPNIGVITNVGYAHIGHFKGKISGVADAKSELIHHMKPNGILLVNADDEHSALLKTASFKGKLRKVGLSDSCDYRAYHVENRANGIHFVVNIHHHPYPFEVKLHGKHNVYNALFAIGVAIELGFSPAEIQKGFNQYKKPKRRLNLIPLRNDIRIIDDSFSANPHAMKAAIDVLASISAKRKIAVLGTMLELGKYTAKAHQDIGAYAAKNEIDYLFTYGKEAKNIINGAISSGMRAPNALWFRNKSNLHPKLLKRIIPDTTILIKGSHQTHMHQTVKRIKRAFKSKKEG